MDANLESNLFVFALAAFLGYEVVRRVSPQLHTPLMSLTNAISAISVVGAIAVTGAGHNPALVVVLGSIAVTAAMINVVGGFLMTDRMLKMFKKRPVKTPAPSADGNTPKPQEPSRG
ncbi:MAG: NAD(P) transhydrogenase subunit alpha [Phycisphaerae bacterium]